MVLHIYMYAGDIVLNHVQYAAKLFKHLRKFLSKNLYIMQFYKINICGVMIFRLYTVYMKHEMIKIVNQTKEKSQILSQVLE